ncbi:MAG: FAD-binding protein, partial [Desulfuromonadales bacterium]|nr:FAD-binding protein [Desulfuromonadales bacterium]
KLTLMSESLRNDGRIWVPKDAADCGKHASEIPEADRDYYLERKYPSFGNLAPRDISSRSAKEACDADLGVGDGKRGVYLDFADAIDRVGQPMIKERYGNLFDMYEKITDENGYERPMRIYPAPHYNMGGLWVDYECQSNIPGLFVLGEANFSVHGANRLGASALMQGLADGYFVIPYTIAPYLASITPGAVKEDHAEFKKSVEDIEAQTNKLLAINGKKTVGELHKELGTMMWENVGMARSDASLKDALKRIPEIRDEFWNNVKVTGNSKEINQQLENAGRLADFLEFAEVMAEDALNREESCGGHFRTEHQTDDGEAMRDDENFSYVAAWEFKGIGKRPELHKEPLKFERVKLAVRSYK